MAEGTTGLPTPQRIEDDRDRGPPQTAGPAELRDPFVRQEFKRAVVWVAVVGGVALAVVLSSSLILIFGGIVFAAMLDGGTRMLGRVLPIGRGWRLLLVVLGVLAFLGWVVMLAGSELTSQAQSLQQTVATQVTKVTDWVTRNHVLEGTRINPAELGREAMGQLGHVTTFLGTAAGFFTSLSLIVVIGVFLAAEPRLYERGLAWMLPMRARASFYEAMTDMGSTLRRLMAGRLLGMAIEGAGVWLLLMLGGIPMAALLGVLTGLLAFLPNVGAIISGALITLVGFSGGLHAGFYAVGVFLVVLMIDGYIIVPTVAKRSVDLAPALVLGAQLLFGTLFGLFGLMFADPLVAMIKVALEHGAPGTTLDESERMAREDNRPPLTARLRAKLS